MEKEKKLSNIQQKQLRSNHIGDIAKVIRSLRKGQFVNLRSAPETDSDFSFLTGEEMFILEELKFEGIKIEYEDRNTPYRWEAEDDAGKLELLRVYKN